MLQPSLERVQLMPNSVLATAGCRIAMMLFPETALVSLGEPLVDGTAAEVGLVGPEGMVGWPSLLGGAHWTHGGTTRRGGTALTIPVEAALLACRCSPSLQALLLRFVHAIMVQMTRAIVSHLQDSVERRLCRWLLMRHDRVPGDELRVTHDEIADHLAVRRASVTDAMHVLEGDRIVRCVRGSLLIRDRLRLEETAGDAYGLAEMHYRSTIGPFGKPAAVVIAAASLH